MLFLISTFCNDVASSRSFTHGQISDILSFLKQPVERPDELNFNIFKLNFVFINYQDHSCIFFSVNSTFLIGDITTD